MSLPSEVFNKKIIGKIITKPLNFGEFSFDTSEYDVIGIENNTYICNVWYKEHKKIPQLIHKDMVQSFKSVNESKNIFLKMIREEIKKTISESEISEDVMTDLIMKQNDLMFKMKEFNDTLKAVSDSADYAKYNKKVDEFTDALMFITSTLDDTESATNSTRDKELEKKIDKELVPYLTKKYNMKIGSGFMGNGLVYWNSNKEVKGDYEQVFHVSKSKGISAIGKRIQKDSTMLNFIDKLKG